MKKAQSVLSLEVATIVFIPIPPVFPLNHIYLEQCDLSKGNLLTNILFYYPFSKLGIQTYCYPSLSVEEKVMAGPCTLAWLCSSNEMYLLRLGEWWL